jgi:hypothetical protein
MKHENSYKSQAKKKHILSGITTDLETKGDLKNTTVETAKDVVVGVVGGGLLGAVMGRWSLAIGAAVTGIGHYTKSRLATIFGVGMMASGSFLKPDETIAGKEEGDMLDGAKDRMLAFKDALSHRLFLDKFIKKSDSAEGEKESVGEVQYFTYPDNQERHLEGANDNQLDLTALERIERQVADSANNFSKQNQQHMSGELPQGEFGELDPEERIY